MRTLKQRKDGAILEIVRAWGVPGSVRMYLVDRALEAERVSEVKAARNAARQLANEFGEIEAMRIEAE